MSLKDGIKSEVNSEDDESNQEDFCRLCVQKVSKYSSIFKDNFHEKLKSLLGLSISIDDNWPKNICSQCKVTSRICLKFISSIQTKEAILRSLFGDLSCSVSDEIATETYDENPNLSPGEDDDSEDSKPLQSRRSVPQTASVPRKSKKRIRRSATVVAEEDERIRNFFTLKCHSCEEVFLNFKDLNGHCFQCHQEEAYLICCKKKLNNRLKIIQHLNSHVNPDAYKCSQCDKIFQTDRGLRLHNLNKHVPKEEHIYKCSKCTCTFMTLSRFRAHEFSHMTDDEKKFKCSQCQKSFPSLSLLTHHERYTHEESNRYVCEICAKVFKSKYSYKIHMNNHLGTETMKFRCTLCDKAFKRKRLLTVHIERHNRQGEIFKCDICGKEAPNSFALKNHMEYSHLKQRKFQCNLCSSAFKTSLGLKEHIATHSSSQILYTCLFCPKQFNSNANKYVHQKRKHPDEYEAMKKAKTVKGL